MGLIVINLLYGELYISLLSMCLSCPAVNYSDAEKINHIGLMSTPENPLMIFLELILLCSRNKEVPLIIPGDVDWESCNSVAKRCCPDFWQNGRGNAEPTHIQGLRN